MARFTIGIPTYNRAGFLRRALEAACEQTSDDVEVLVSDNASTDNTEAVVRSFGDRVRYHRNPTNIGLWRNFGQGADPAGGDYLAWLQDDDLIPVLGQQACQSHSGGTVSHHRNVCVQCDSFSGRGRPLCPDEDLMTGLLTSQP